MFSFFIVFFFMLYWLLYALLYSWSLSIYEEVDSKLLI